MWLTAVFREEHVFSEKFDYQHIAAKKSKFLCLHRCASKVLFKANVQINRPRIFKYLNNLTCSSISIIFLVELEEICSLSITHYLLPPPTTLLLLEYVLSNLQTYVHGKTQHVPITCLSYVIKQYIQQLSIQHIFLIM